MVTKKEIRQMMRSMKMSVSKQEKRTAACSVFDSLMALDVWNKAKRILLYHSLPDELPTVYHINNIQDKEIFLPRVNGDELDVVAYSECDLQTGSYNISEPNGKAVTPDTIDVMVIPGMAFDTDLNRLGRGKGFYDRLLSSTHAIKIGICYDFQLIKHIPTDQHDIKMDIIITPNRIISKSKL